MNESIEHIGDDYGVTVRYTLHENGLSVNFFAAEITGRSVPGGVPSYKPKNNDGSHYTESFTEAERYVDGCVKWDGCAHYYFGDEQGYLHLCGPKSVAKLGETIRVIFQRCGELMQEAGTNLLEGEFDCCPVTPKKGGVGR